LDTRWTVTVWICSIIFVVKEQVAAKISEFWVR